MHPCPIPWNTLISSFAHKLGLATVSYAEWFTGLSEAHDALYSRAGAEFESEPSSATSSQADSAGASRPAQAALEKALRDNPALRLLEFFRATLKKHDDNYRDLDLEPLGMTRLGCEKTMKVSRHLRDAVEGLGEMHVERWLGAWKRAGFIQ